MKTFLLAVSWIVLTACSASDSQNVPEERVNLPEMNAYSDQQNVFLERNNWLGFNPSIVRSVPLKDQLGVIFGYGGNVLVSVGTDGVLIVDSQFPEVYEVMLQEIQKLGGDSVDYIINSHFHFDHAEGNRAFGALGANIIAHDNSIDYFNRGSNIDLVTVAWPQQPYEPEAIPGITYSDSMTLNYNGHTIQIMNFGPAHTSGDSFVYFKESNVIHMGDVANLTGLPFIDAGNGGTLRGMIYSIRQVMELINEETIVVPGHGEISRKSDLEDYVSKMEVAEQRISTMIQKGMSLEEVMDENPAADLFPSSPFDAGTGIAASKLFVNRSYVSMTK